MFKEGQIKNRERRKVKQGMQTIVTPSWDWIENSFELETCSILPGN